MSEMHQNEPSIVDRIEASLSPEQPAETQEPVQDSIESRIDQHLEPEQAPEATESPVEETSPEPDTEPTPEENVAEEASEEPSEEIEEVSIDNLQKLAEFMDVDVADLYNVTIPITEDGVRTEVTIGDLKDGATTAKAAQKAKQEALELRQQLEQEQTQFQEQANAYFTQAQGYLQNATNVLTAEFQKVDWDGLMQNDPGQYAALRQQYTERNAQIQQAWQGVQQEYAQHQGQMQEAQAQKIQEYVKAEESKLLEKVPEWQDVKVRQSETGKLRDYLQETGFSEAEVDRAYDHKMLVLARKAMLFDQMSSKAEVAKKKVAKLGNKTLKPGARQSKRDQQHDRNTKLRQQVRKTGNVNDAAAAIASLL